MMQVVNDTARMRSHAANLKSRARFNTLHVGKMSEDEIEELGLGPTRFQMSMNSRQRHEFSRECKSSRKRFAPLQRFLHSRIGKLWTSVLAEISQPGNRDVSRLVDEVLNFVTVTCSLGGDGEVIDLNYGGWKVSGFYVHPTSGTLQFEAFPKYRGGVSKEESEKCRFLYSTGLAADTKRYRVVSDTLVLEKREGSWFGLEIKSCEKVPGSQVYDPMGGRFVKRSTWSIIPTYQVRQVVRIWQLGKRELRRYASKIA